jgi:tellurite resistance protein
MGIFGSVKSMMSGKISQFNGNKDFLEGVCAACALVAAADGDISDTEVSATVKAISSNKNLLSAFTSSEIERTADMMLQRAKGGRVGRAGLYTEIREVADKDKQGQMKEAILLSALDVADEGGIDDKEREVLKKISETLGLSLAKYEV